MPKDHPITIHLKTAKRELKAMKKADPTDPQIPVKRQLVASYQSIVDKAHSFIHS